MPSPTIARPGGALPGIEPFGKSVNSLSASSYPEAADGAMCSGTLFLLASFPACRTLDGLSSAVDGMQRYGYAWQQALSYLVQLKGAACLSIGKPRRDWEGGRFPVQAIASIQVLFDHHS